MYHTNKKKLELNKIKEMHYFDKIEKIKTELSLKSILLKYLSWIVLFLLMSLPLLTYAQIDTCNVCNSVNLTSTYNPAYTHTWVCSDGQATNDVNPTLTVTEDMLCILTINDGTCTKKDSIYLNNCECTIQAELTYSNDTLFVTVDDECNGDPEEDPYFEWHFWNGSSWVLVDGSVNPYLVIEDPGLYRMTVECDDCIVQKTYEVDCVGSDLEITNFSNSFDGITNVGEDYLIFEIDGCASPLLAILQKKISGTWVALDTFTNVTSYFWNGFGGGEYRLIAQGCGCTEIKTFTLNLPCSVSVNITNSGSLLSANINGNVCPDPIITWSCVVVSGCTTGTIVGTGPTYNATTEGTYYVYVDCGGGCVNAATYTYNSCPLNITGIVPNILMPPFGVTINTTGCIAPNNKLFEIYKETFVGSGIWNFITSTNSLSTSVNMDLGSYGSFKIEVTGCSCTRTIFYNNIVDCGTYTVGITGWGNPCNETSEIYTATWSGGGGITSVLWYVNGVSTGITTTTYVHNFTTVGITQIRADFTTTAGCTGTFTRNVLVVDCGPPPCTFDVEINEGSLLLCSGLSQNFTTSIANGTGPYTYTWSYILGGVTTSQGSGATKNILFTTTGTYQIVVTTIDGNGCIDTDILFVEVESCIDCDCTPELTLQGCLLIIGNAGGSCLGFNYQLQYLSGSDWINLATGAVTSGTTVSFTPAANGLYRLRISKTGCGEIISSILNVTCVVLPCSNQPNLLLSTYSTISCDLNPSITTGSISGSATTATVTHNGSGTFNLTWNTSTTFTFTYFPVSADLGNTVTVRFLTNNPLGFPCVPKEIFLAVFVGEILEPVITSSGAPMCANSIRTLTAIPFGGIWSIESGPGILVGNQLTATGAGTIVIGYQINSGGCFTGESMSITVTNCVTTFTNTGCVLSATFSGCTDYTYQLQYSPTGTGWTTKQSGSVVNFTYNPTQNGFYRLIAVKSGCLTVIKELEVTCVPCGVPTLTFNVITEGASTCSRFFCIDDVNPSALTNTSSCNTGNCPGGCSGYYNVLGLNTVWDFTLTSDKPVTWNMSHLVPSQSINFTILSQTATQITFHVLGFNSSSGAVAAAIPCRTTPVLERPCGVCFVNFMARLTATDACGNVVFNKLFIKSSNN